MTTLFLSQIAKLRIPRHEGRECKDRICSHAQDSQSRCGQVCKDAEYLYRYFGTEATRQRTTLSYKESSNQSLRVVQRLFSIRVA
jgi:hypothetical protein